RLSSDLLRHRLTRLRPALPTGLRLLLQRAERAGGDRLVPRPDQVGERLVDRLDAGLRLVEGRLVRGIAAGPLGERGGAVPGGVVGGLRAAGRSSGEQDGGEQDGGAAHGGPPSSAWCGGRDRSGGRRHHVDEWGRPASTGGRGGPRPGATRRATPV